MKALSLFIAKRTFLGRRAGIYAKMAFGLKRGGTPANEFRAMYANAVRRKSSLSPVYRHWDETLRGSAAGRMAKAMQSTLPASEFGLLSIAEENQALVQGLEFLAVSVKRVGEMRSGFITAIRSTALPLFMLLCGIVATDWYFFPQLEETLARREWPIVTRLVATIAHELGSVMAIFMLFAPILIGAWIWSLPRMTGRPRWLLEQLPLVYNKYRDFQCVIFQVNLAFLRESGVAPRKSLEEINKIATPYMRWHIDRMLAMLNKDATNFGDVLVSTELFSPDLAELISDYARWSDWHSQMRSIADTAMDIVTEEVKRLGPLMHDLLQLAIGAVIFIILAASSSAVVKVMMTSSR